MSGWDDFDEPVATDRRDVTQKREDIDRLFLRVLGTDDGKELMGILRKWYLEEPVATPGSPADFAFHREGQNSVVRDIEARLRRALNG